MWGFVFFLSFSTNTHVFEAVQQRSAQGGRVVVVGKATEYGTLSRRHSVHSGGTVMG